MNNSLFRFSLFTFLLFLSTAALAQQTLREIKVSGLERLEPETVTSYMNLKQGQPLTQQSIDSALRDLFQTGLFADVKVRAENGIMSVFVIENPIINQIAFEGNRLVRDPS